MRRFYYGEAGVMRKSRVPSLVHAWYSYLLGLPSGIEELLQFFKKFVRKGSKRFAFGPPKI